MLVAAQLWVEIGTPRRAVGDGGCLHSGEDRRREARDVDGALDDSAADAGSGDSLGQVADEVFGDLLRRLDLEKRGG